MENLAMQPHCYAENTINGTIMQVILSQYKGHEVKCNFKTFKPQINEQKRKNIYMKKNKTQLRPLSHAM